MDVSTLIILVAAVAAFASVLAVGMTMVNRDQLSSRLKAVAARRQELSAQQRAQLKGARRFQAPQRHVGLMKAVLARLNLQDMIEGRALKARLSQAGWRSATAAVNFTFARVASPVIGLAVALLYASSVFAASPPMTRMMMILGGLGLGYFLPQILLANAIQKRQFELARAFPDCLDLLVICVEAGLSVEMALARVTDELAESSPLMAEEIGLTAAELAFLSDRRQAWDNLAERTGLAQVKSLCTALVQAEKYGTPVSQALRVLAAENRESRMAAAEKKAAALPAKLTVPMIIFFLPVLFMVIAGPAAIQVAKLK
ncbi:MAG: type II secretion system F family protein [Magnetospirillum sp.]|nr:type II secretion system F family protein [Magnetospirillum sp.]